MQTVTVPMESLAEIIKLQLESAGRANLTVTGSSMLPMLRNRRDTVTLIPVSDPQKGDVVLFQRKSGQYILHRIVAVTKDGYICCGDNQAELEPVTGDQMIAVVDSFTRKRKRYTVDALGYRLYTAVWVNLFFLRRPYIALRRCLGRLRSKLRNRNK